MQTKAPLLRSLGSSLFRLFFPRLCEGCSQPLLGQEDTLCIGCTAHLPLTEYHDIPDNDTALRFAGRVPFQYASSLAYFTAEGLLQHLLHELKYRDKQEIAIYLGRQFGYSLRDSGWIQEIDCIIPVPLHPKKEALRGFNQSYRIAEGMSDVLGIPISHNNLHRSRHTESQTKKSRTERVDNMKDVFAVRDEQALAGRHVLLVDDVLTTGATMEACAQSLLLVPGLKVSFGSIGIAMD